MNRPPESSSRKRKKLPSLGSKLNKSSNAEEEQREVQSFLLQQKELLEEQKIEKNHLLISAEWDDSLYEAKVTKNSGSSLEVFGHNRSGHVFLYPEEALYLIEMACKHNKLQLFYNKIRLSVQRSYSVLLQPACGVSILHYRVYKHFVIQGYKLFRHESLPNNSTLIEMEKPNVESAYGEFLQTLQIFEASKPDDYESTHVPRIFYDVFIPNATVKKSCRPEPNYYLIILSSDEKLWNLMHLVSFSRKTNLLFASAEANTVSVFNLQGLQIPNLC